MLLLLFYFSYLEYRSYVFRCNQQTAEWICVVFKCGPKSQLGWSSASTQNTETQQWEADLIALLHLFSHNWKPHTVGTVLSGTQNMWRLLLLSLCVAVHISVAKGADNNAIRSGIMVRKIWAVIQKSHVWAEVYTDLHDEKFSELK